MADRRFWWMMALGVVVGAGAVKAVLKPTDHSISAASREPAGRQSCDTAGSLKVCAKATLLRSSVSDGYEGSRARGDSTFVLVRSVVENDGDETESFSFGAFTLKSGDRTWEADDHATRLLLESGTPTFVMVEVHPGMYTEVWSVFFAPRSVLADAHLGFKPGLVYTADVALPGIGDTPATCTAPSGEAGSCVDVAACTGRHYAGRCEGAATVQCCVP
ncbi:MAG TPA: hypothetical protein VGM88_09965 [Kofleriaceae bacterium]